MDATEVEETTKSYKQISKTDKLDSIGVANGAVYQVVEKKGKHELKWVSDCVVRIHTETVANGKTEFTFEGIGAKDSRKVKFTLPAEDLADVKKFTAALINAFGAKNRVGGLKFQMVQGMTRGTKRIKRVEAPEWDNNIPLIPGVDLAKDVEFKLSPMTPARVINGDLQTAKDLLRTALKTHRYAPIVITAIMGAPATARWRPDDRVGVGLWAVTGELKTTAAQAYMTIFGSEFRSDTYLLKHGKAGTTLVAAMEVMAATGILARILDNVKTVDDKDRQMYVSIVHAVQEGSDKQRGKKDGGLRDSHIFRCTLIVTGEVRPEEASTDARICNISWSKPDLEKLSEIQSRANEMPIIGYHWLKFLADTKFSLNDGFNEARSKKELEFSKDGYVNPGRLATIYTVLTSTWDLLCASPLGDVFKEFTTRFTSALDDIIKVQGAIVNSDTEVSKFLAGVDELIASQPSLFEYNEYGRSIGKQTDEGLFLLPSETLSELNKRGTFTQRPTVDSMTKSLRAAGKLVIDKDGRHLQVQRSMGESKRVRGWLLTPDALSFDSTPVESENAQQETPNSTNSTDSTEKSKSFIDSKKVQKTFQQNSGVSGVSGVDIAIDNDFNDSTTDSTTPLLAKREDLNSDHATLPNQSDLSQAKTEESPYDVDIMLEKWFTCKVCGDYAETDRMSPVRKNCCKRCSYLIGRAKKLANSLELVNLDTFGKYLLERGWHGDLPIKIMAKVLTNIGNPTSCESVDMLSCSPSTEPVQTTLAP